MSMYSDTTPKVKNNFSVNQKENDFEIERDEDIEDDDFEDDDFEDDDDEDDDDY